ncbi:MAG: hypothetical protein AAFX78_14660 [Cyanobacteria bacterium J06638_20]
MKYLLFFIFHFPFFVLSAQETTTSITRTSDSTFVQENVTVYADGRTVTEQVPYSLEAFANLIVDRNLNNLVRIDQLAKAQSIAQQDVNQLRKYLADSLQVDYDSLLATKLLVALDGNWTLIERNGSSSKTNVAIAAHSSNSTLLRLRNTGGSGAWNIKPIHSQKFLLRNYDGEDVEMQLTQFNSFTGYRGKTTDGRTLILRR